MRLQAVLLPDAMHRGRGQAPTVLSRYRENRRQSAGMCGEPLLYCGVLMGSVVIADSLSLRFEGADLGVKVSAVCPGDMKTSIYENMVVMNLKASREEIVAMSRRSHFLIPQISAQQAAVAILRGVRRNQALIIFPGAVRFIWRMYRAFPGLIYWISVRRMRMFRQLRQDSANMPVNA